MATHSTEAHKVGGAFGGEDAHYFLDLDMAVLGSSPDSYAEYRERIRGEYSFLSEPMYTALRLKVSFILMHKTLFSQILLYKGLSDTIIFVYLFTSQRVLL